MQYPILSILIPTFNQPTELEHSLDSFSRDPEILNLINKRRIEILISDKSSEVNLEKSKLLAEKIGLIWHTQEPNVGFRKDVEHLANNASGQYLVIIGSGETIDSKYLDQLLQTLNSGNYCLGTIGTQRFSPSDGLVQLTKSRFEKPKLRFSVLRPTYAETISGNIYRTSKFVDYFHRAIETLGSWPHIELSLFLMEGLKTSELLYFPDAVVIIFASPDGWWENPKNYKLFSTLKFDQIKRKPYPLAS